MRQIAFLFLFLLLIACHRTAFKEKWLQEKSPQKFAAKFETSKGNFEVSFTREWSPLAVDKVYAQIKHGFYNRTLFYRVNPKYAQFGADDSLRIQFWSKNKIPDEPALQPNERGTICFARGGKDSRDHNLFFNIVSNSPRLDTIFYNGVRGFPVIGKVTNGMSVIDSLYNGYDDSVFSKYNTLLSNKKAFLEIYPKLDSIIRLSIIL